MSKTIVTNLAGVASIWLTSKSVLDKWLDFLKVSSIRFLTVNVDWVWFFFSTILYPSELAKPGRFIAKTSLTRTSLMVHPHEIARNLGEHSSCMPFLLRVWDILFREDKSLNHLRIMDFLYRMHSDLIDRDLIARSRGIRSCYGNSAVYEVSHRRSSSYVDCDNYLQLYTQGSSCLLSSCTS